MSIQTYKQSTIKPEELSKQVFGSVCRYLKQYKDTSNTKDARLKALDNARVITDWVVFEISKHTHTFEQELIQHSLEQMLKDINVGLDFKDKLIDMSDHIAFVKILAGDFNE